MTDSNDIYSYSYETDYPDTSLISTELSVPLSIFSSELSGLQAITRYLHEDGKLSFTKIATLLNRSPKTIWTTYQAAVKLPFMFSETSFRIDVSSFATRTFSVLETVVKHLNELGFSNAETARLLAIDPRTAWTIKSRAAKKEVRHG